MLTLKLALTFLDCRHALVKGYEKSHFYEKRSEAMK